jgi:hypothetical protein
LIPIKTVRCGRGGRFLVLDQRSGEAGQGEEGRRRPIMTLTPFMILILAAFAVFIGVLGVVSVWTKAGERRSVKAQSALSAEPQGSRPSVS